MEKIKISNENYRLQIVETDASREPVVYSLFLKIQCPRCGHFELAQTTYGVMLTEPGWADEFDLSMAALDTLPEGEDKRKIIKHVNEMIEKEES